MHTRFGRWGGIVSLALLAAACSAGEGGQARLVGGPCAYRDIPGTAYIVALTPAGADQSNCPQDPVAVTFDFVPDDPGLAAKQANGRTLTVGAGMHPNRAYIQAKGFTAGARLRCMRREIVTGTCTPVLYKFPGIDLSDYAGACFGR